MEPKENSALRGHAPAWPIGAGLALVLVLVVAGCRSESHEQDAKDVLRPLAVTYVAAKVRSIEDTEEAIATVHAKRAPGIAAEVEGTLNRVLVDEGDVVADGALLAEIDSADYEIEHRRAVAEMRRLEVLIKQKEREIDRQEQLSQSGHTPQSHMENVRSDLATLTQELAVARSDVERADSNIERTEVRAPYKGLIASRDVSDGDFVDTGTRLFEMTANSLLQVRIPLPEAIGHRLEPGQEVRLSRSTSAETSYVGHIAQISPQVNGANRSVTAIAEMHNLGKWRAGISLNAEVVLEQRKSIVVPAESVVRRPAGEVVYIVISNAAKERAVETGQHTGGGIEILKGIQSGDRVVVDGAGFLSDDATIDATPHEDVSPKLEPSHRLTSH